MTVFKLWQPTIAHDQDRSFWLQDIAAQPATPPFSGDKSCNVAIVGGGFTGLWTALRLKEQDPELKITILEADQCGAGASGRNGGQVHTWFAEMDLLTHLIGEDEALDLSRATAEAVEELAELQASGRIDMDLRLDGWMWTASSTAQEDAWNAALELCEKKAEKRFLPLSASEIRARTGSGASYLGVVEPRAGTVHPGKLATGLRALALSRGVIIHEKSPVLQIEAGERCTLQCARGQLHADKVVLATNAWASAIPELRRYMYVVESQIVVTEPIGSILEEIGWTGGESICDAQSHVLYYQRTPGGRVVFGRGSGHIAYGGRFGATFNRRRDGTKDNIRELRRVYPELANARIEYDWTGPIDCMAEHLPVFGTLSGIPSIFYGVGFNGTGIAQTPVGGRILASLILGKNDRWSRSGLVGLQSRTKLPPEPIRYLGARAVRQAIRIRNDLEIQNRKAGPLVRWLSQMTPGR